MDNPAVRRYAGFAWFALAYTLAVILWGALVRATGSGAGCGNHWPLCAPAQTTTATVIEFTHRAMTGLDALVVLALVVFAFRVFPKGHPARLGATLSGVFLITESLLGALLVKLEHVARNASVGRLYSLSCHLTNTLALVASLALTAWWASGRPAVRLRGKPWRRAVVVLLAVVAIGISGAVAALGDTLFPAQSLAESMRQDFDPAANLFLRLRVWHPVVAVLAALWVLVYARRGPRPASAPRLGGLVALLVLLQLSAGVLNLWLLAPIWMQLVHLLLADLLWIALVLLCAARLAAEP